MEAFLKVECDRNLDMREFVQGPTDGKPMLYDLCAVSVRSAWKRKL